MSLADTIGFVFVCLVGLLTLAWVSIEGYWRIRQRIDYLKAQTDEKRRQYTMRQMEEVASRGTSVFLGVAK